MPRGGRISLKQPDMPLPDYETRLMIIAPQHNIKRMVIEIRLGDVVRLKKKHPCGGYEWQVVKLGADIRIKCLKCQRVVLIERSVLERRIDAFVSRGK